MSKHHKFSEAAIAEMAATLSQKRNEGCEIFFLASLEPAMRDNLATKEERAAASVMRKTCVMSGKAAKFLGCTQTELDRWDADGRCPHLFLARNPVYSSMPPARKWALLALSEAKNQIGRWRAQDALVPRKKSEKLRKIITSEYVDISNQRRLTND